MSTDEARRYLELIATHSQQVAEGLIAADSPPDFVRPVAPMSSTIEACHGVRAGLEAVRRTGSRTQSPNG